MEAIPQLAFPLPRWLVPVTLTKNQLSKQESNSIYQLTFTQMTWFLKRDIIKNKDKREDIREIYLIGV